MHQYTVTGQPPVPGHFVNGVNSAGQPALIPHAGPNYLEGDRRVFGEAGLGICCRVRPILISDMLVGIAYPPGAVLISKHYAEFGVVVRMVAVVPPEDRDDPLLALESMLARGGTMTLPLYLAKIEGDRKTSRLSHLAQATIPIEESVVMTFI